MTTERVIKSISFCVLLLLSLTASAETLMGHATAVRDGDTIVASGVPIRLQGVAARNAGFVAVDETRGDLAAPAIIPSRRVR